jgi:hypothetical protein
LREGKELLHHATKSHTQNTDNIKGKEGEQKAHTHQLMGGKIMCGVFRKALFAKAAPPKNEPFTDKVTHKPFIKQQGSSAHLAIAQNSTATRANVHCGGKVHRRRNSLYQCIFHDFCI